MKKLNTTNKIYLAILVILIIATGIKLYLYKSWDRYYYGASFSSPRTYPVYMRNGYFILNNGEMKYFGSSDINTNGAEWGDGDYDSPTTKELLPVKLVLEYASYRDKLFYKDTIPLPAGTIKKAFQNMGEDGISTELYGSMPAKRLDFVVGVANKGNIIIWLRSKNKETVLLKHKINPHQPVGDETYHDGRLTKEKYLEQVFYIDSAIKADFNKGIDRNANYIDTPSSFSIRLKNK